MKVEKVISRSADGNRAEVLARRSDLHERQTLHIHWVHGRWIYHAGWLFKGRLPSPVLKPIEGMK